MNKKNLSQDEVTSLPKSLIQVGLPLQFPIYDVRGQLLMQQGAVVSSEDQLKRLQERGLYLNKKTVDQLPSSGPLSESEKPKPVEDSGPKKQVIDLKINDIQLGESLHISPLTDETDTTKYIVKFLGGKEKGSIICSAPMRDGKLVFVKEGSGFLFRLFSGKEMYNFTSIITAIYSKPYPHIHLKYPQSVNSLNIRRDHRAQVNIISSIINKTNNAFKDTKFSGRMVNVSIGGAAIESNTPIGDMNDEVECTFKLELLKKEIFFSIPCILRKSDEPSAGEKSQKYTHGLQFKEIPFEQKIMLQNHIYQVLDEQ